MSKGSRRRPENPDKEPGAYERGWSLIDWDVCDPEVMDRMLAQRDAERATWLLTGKTPEEQHVERVERQLRTGEPP